MVAVCTNDRNLSFVPTHKYRARGWTSYKYRFSSLQCDVIGPGIEPISFSGSQARSQVLRFGGTKYIFNEAKFLFLLCFKQLCPTHGPVKGFVRSSLGFRCSKSILIILNLTYWLQVVLIVTLSRLLPLALPKFSLLR